MERAAGLHEERAKQVWEIALQSLVKLLFYSEVSHPYSNAPLRAIHLAEKLLSSVALCYMKIFIILASSAISLQAFSQVDKAANTKDTRGNTVHYLSRTDAEKILGQPATLTESTVEKSSNVAKYNCTFTANDSMAAGNRTAHLYYAIELYYNEASAKNVYAGIFAQNAAMPNLKKQGGLGDEALLHTDNQNFALLIVRKGAKILRLKVNRLTKRTSERELLAVAANQLSGLTKPAY